MSVLFQDEMEYDFLEYKAQLTCNINNNMDKEPTNKVRTKQFSKPNLKKIVKFNKKVSIITIESYKNELKLNSYNCCNDKKGLNGKY